MAVTLQRQAIAAGSRRFGRIEIVRDTAMDAPSERAAPNEMR